MCLQQPQFRLRTRCTIHVKHFGGVACDVFRPNRFACTAAAGGDEEFVAAPDLLELSLELLQLRLHLESSDLAFQGLDNDATLFFEKNLLLLNLDVLEIAKIPNEVRDALQIFLVKRS